jgi:magnesium-transporting ATPase (P-type)
MLFNGFSGVSFVNDFNLMCYNAIFTLLPVIFFLFDKDVDEVTVFLHPYVYTDSRRQTLLNRRTLFWWIIRAIYQAVVVSALVFNIFTENNIDAIDGTASNLSETQQVAYTGLIMIVVITTTIDTQNFTSLNFIFIWGNWVLYLACASIANVIFDLSITRDMYLVMWRVMSSAKNWLVVMVLCGVATIPVFFIQSLFATYLPTRTQSLRYYEIQKGSKYEPVYYFDLSKTKGFCGDAVYAAPQETVWDKTYSIFAPLLTLFGCSKY